MSDIAKIQSTPHLDSTTNYLSHESDVSNSKELEQTSSTVADVASVKSNVVTPKQIARNVAFLEGLPELMAAVAESGVESARTGQALQKIYGTDVRTITSDQTKEGERYQLSRIADVKNAKAREALNTLTNALAMTGMCIAGALEIAGGNPVAGVLTIGMTIGSYIVTEVKVQGDKTPLDLLSECHGMNKESANALLFGLTVIVTAGAAAGVAVAKGASTAAKIGAEVTTDVLEEGTETALKSAVKSVGREVEIEMVEMSTTSLGKQAVKAVKQTEDAVAREVEEQIILVASKQGLKEETEKAIAKKALEAAKGEMEQATQALDQLVKKGIISGVKFGVSQGIAYFNPLGDVAADLYYKIEVAKHPEWTQADKDACKSDSQIAGAVVGAASSLGYGLASCKFTSLTGADFLAGNSMLKPAMQVLVQRVLIGVQALTSMSRGVCAALLGDLLLKSAQLTEEMADAQASTDRLQYAGKTMLDAQKQAQSFTGNAMANANQLLMLLSNATVNAVKI